MKVKFKNDNVCPNCGWEFTKINKEVTNRYIIQKINNYYDDKNYDSYCEMCSSKLLKGIIDRNSNRDARMKNLISKIGSIENYLIKNMPIVTTHTPYNWKYKTVGIVTGLANMGTGIFSDVGSTITDFLGIQSNLYNSKIRDSEELCMNQLRLKTLRKGGNAIIAVDIDYNEIGGVNQIQMVAMAGTAVKLENFEEVIDKTFDREKYNDMLNEYNDMLNEYNELNLKKN